MPHSRAFPFGLTPVPRDPETLQPSVTAAPHISLDSLTATIPKTALVSAAVAYLKPILPLPTWNHSHRAYLHGAAIAQGIFADWNWDAESFYLSCLFHDLGCIPENLKKTKMSFEFYGAFLARDFILNTSCSPSQELRDLADSVGEAIARHTDLNVGGKITTNGQLIQLGTLFDNIGLKAEWIHPDTAKEIVEAWPRHGWTKCFGDAMHAEVEAKPWAHTTFFDDAGVWDKVKGNAVAAPFEAAEEKAKQT